MKYKFLLRAKIRKSLKKEGGSDQVENTKRIYTWGPLHRRRACWCNSGCYLESRGCTYFPHQGNEGKATGANKIQIELNKVP